jgi:hypothetical protein
MFKDLLVFLLQIYQFTTFLIFYFVELHFNFVRTSVYSMLFNKLFQVVLNRKDV